MLAVLLIPIGISVAHGKYGDFEQYKTHKWHATRTAIYGFLGLSKGTWEVREGKLEVLDKPDGSLARFGGPGDLIVQQGHAVILERNGKVTNVVGSGLTFLKAFERVSIVVPLYTRTEHVIVEQVMTRDRMPIQSFEFFVFHKADAGPEEERVRDRGLFFNRQIWPRRYGLRTEMTGATRSKPSVAGLSVMSSADIHSINLFR